MVTAFFYVEGLVRKLLMYNVLAKVRHDDAVFLFRKQYVIYHLPYLAKEDDDVIYRLEK